MGNHDWLGQNQSPVQGQSSASLSQRAEDIRRTSEEVQEFMSESWALVIDMLRLQEVHFITVVV